MIVFFFLLYPAEQICIYIRVLCSDTPKTKIHIPDLRTCNVLYPMLCSALRHKVGKLHLHLLSSTYILYFSRRIGGGGCVQPPCPLQAPLPSVVNFVLSMVQTLL